MPDDALPPEVPETTDEMQLLTPPTGGAPLLPPAAPQHEVIGDFEILGRLGAGGMGAVYRARQISLDRLVALKILPAHFADQAESVIRFQREARAAASLSHPNLVRVYAAGEAGGCHYIAMELIDGEDLGRRLKTLGRLMPGEALRICGEVIRGLQHGWERAQLVHRDIKPGNIFLAADGGVKLGDLGLAKLLDSSSTGLTQTGAMMGTPHYISPEQARGDRDIDFRADIYSLGCTLFQMLTGHTPYHGGDPVTIIHQHIHAPLPAMLKAWPECPVPLVRFVGRMLKKHRHERYGSYAELLTALETTWAQIDPVGYNPQAFAPPAKPDPDATLLASPAGVGRVAPPATRATPAGEDTRPTTTRSRIPLYAGLLAAAVLLIATVIFLPQNDSRSSSSQIAAAPATSSRGAANQKPPQSSPAPQRAETVEMRNAPDGRKPATPSPAASSQPTTPTVVPREWLISKTANVPPPADALEFQGSKYKLIREAVPWLEAKAKAEAMGGHLATITTREEHDWLATQVPIQPEGEEDELWLGGGVAAGTDDWRWWTGEPAAEIFWYPGHPNWRSDPAKAQRRGVKFAGALTFSANDRGKRPGRITVTPVQDGGDGSRLTFGYLVEWDRFSAADAAANDPAKWTDWLADARAQGKTTLGDRNNPLDAKGWHTEGHDKLGFPALKLRDCMARIRFEGDGLTMVAVNLRDTVASDKATAQFYDVSIQPEQLCISLQHWRASPRTASGTNLVSPLRRSILGKKEAHTLEVRAIDDLLLLFVDGELLLSARDATLKEGGLRFQVRGTGLVTEISTQSLDAPAGSGPQSGTGVPPVQTAQNTGGTPVPLSAPAPPKPLSEMEKWLAGVDGPQQAAFRKEVVQPHESGLAELRRKYVAALERAIADFSKRGKLEDALAHRTERDTFATAQTLPPDDSDQPLAAIQTLRKAYRTELARFDKTRLTAAQGLHAKYDAVLAQSQTALTQRHRLDDALLLKTHRDKVKAAWLGEGAADSRLPNLSSAPEARTSPAPTPPSTPGQPGVSPSGTRPVVKKYPKGDDRKAAEWVLNVGGTVRIRDGARHSRITKIEDLPARSFDLTVVNLVFESGPPKQPVTSLEPLAGLAEVAEVAIKNLPLHDDDLAPLLSLAKLRTLNFWDTELTDDCVGYLTQMPSLEVLYLLERKGIEGRRLGELADTKVMALSLFYCQLSPEAFSQIARCKKLTRLTLGSTSTKDADLVPLARMVALSDLNLNLTEVTLAGMQTLKPLRNLRTIGWSFAPGEARQQFGEIARLFPQLTKFSSEDTTASYSEADVAAFDLFPHLTELYWSGKNMNDDAIRGVLSVKGMKRLHLRNPSITDIGLGHIAAHKGITEVICSEAANITDAGLLKLAAMRQLTRLEVPNGRQLTPAGFAAFQKARPDVTLIR